MHEDINAAKIILHSFSNFLEDLENMEIKHWIASKS